MIDLYDIDALHDRAEELAALAKHTADPEKAKALRDEATALVRRAATLREIGDADEEADEDLFEPYDDEVMYR